MNFVPSFIPMFMAMNSKDEKYLDEELNEEDYLDEDDDDFGWDPALIIVGIILAFFLLIFGAQYISSVLYPEEYEWEVTVITKPKPSTEEVKTMNDDGTMTITTYENGHAVKDTTFVIQP